MATEIKHGEAETLCQEKREAPLIVLNWKVLFVERRDDGSW